MASWGSGPYSIGPWGGSGASTAYGLLNKFKAISLNPNEIQLSWSKPVGLPSDQEIIICRRKDSFPMELFNDDALYLAQQMVSGFTDPVQVEIFRGSIIRGSNGVASGDTLTDGSASFPNLTGRILRDSNSRNYRIIDNTGTTITVDGTPASGVYVVLVDFPDTNDAQIDGTSTAVGAGFLTDVTQSFTPGALSDRILTDSNGDKFIIFSNTVDTIIVSGTPVAGNYAVLQEFVDYNSPSASFKGQFRYIDNYLNDSEALARIGTGLEDDQFYYYTGFVKRSGTNNAEALFSLVSSETPTQISAISYSDRNFKDLLLNLWPNVHRLADTTGDLEDLMAVFGKAFDEVYSHVHNFQITNQYVVPHTLAIEQARQLGISQMDYQLGVDTLRRIAIDLLPTYKKKGSKDGIKDFIRLVTTWDVTDGTDDSSAIIDSVENSDALRFYSNLLIDSNDRFHGFIKTHLNDPFVAFAYNSGTGVIQYGSSVDLSEVAVGHVFVDADENIFTILAVDDALDRVTIATGQTVVTGSNGFIYEPVAIPTAGKFYLNLPGIVLPGFFDFREFIVNVNDVALWVGDSTSVTVGVSTSVLVDTAANFGGVNNLVNNYLIPKQDQPNDIFRIIANTATSITVVGNFRDSTAIGSYAVLSPLNATRYQKILSLMENYAPSFARMRLNFT